MVYTIELPPKSDNVLHGKVILDIEFWLNDYDDKSGITKWYTKCNTTIVPKGIVPFIKMENRNSELITDLEGLIYFNRWVNEECEDGNRILPMKEASERMYKLHHPELLKRIKNFCEKYYLIYNVD